jgi:F0F1-type ATP synthase membrane subunit b/b'
MDSINITRKIVIKQLVTEEFKKTAVADLQNALKQAETEMDDFEKKYRKMITEFTVKNLPQVDELRAQFEAEKERKSILKNQLSEQFKAAMKLEIGSEIVQAVIDGPYELKVGDDFNKVNRQEIVIKDGIVQEIR